VKRHSFNFGRAALLASVAISLGAAAQAQSNQPRTPVYPTDLTNIALASNGGRILNVTSVLDNDKTLGAENLIDGQVYDAVSQSGSGGWASNKFDPVNMDSVTIGFSDNRLRRIGKIVLNPSSAVAPERWAKDVEIQVSTDTASGPYKAVAQLTLKREATAQEFIILPAQARFVRLMFRSNWGSDRAVSLGEVEIYEAIPQDDPVGMLIARLQSAINDLNRYKQTQNDLRGNASTRVASTQGDERVAQALAGNAPAFTGGNIASAKNGGKIVDVTSTFNRDEAFAAKNLIDGENYNFEADKGSFGWASDGFTPGRQWVTVGFRDDRTHVINKAVLNPVSNQNSMRWASRVEMQVTIGSATEGPFRTVAAFNIRQEAANQDFTFRPVEAKYVRFVFTANGPGNPLPQGDPNISSDRAVSLGEIELYEPDISTADLDAIIGRFQGVANDLKRLRPNLSKDETPAG
jgi:hypothetical protein